MVHVLVNVGFEWIVQRLIDRFGEALRDRLRVDTYQSVLVRRRIPAGTYVFSDLDRVPRGDADDVLALWDHLQASGRARVLNDPRRVRLRYDLLGELQAQGINDFKAVRAGEDLSGLRYPVFVRCEHDHAGPRSGLVDSPDALADVLGRLRRHRAWRHQLLVTEYAAAPDVDGLFRKYGALSIGGRILPWHVIAGRTWLVKSDERVVDDRLAAEELRYLRDNPHEEALRRAFAIAGIDYGRIDYGFVQGRLQVYEINTNPAIVGRGRGRSRGGRRPKPPDVVEQLTGAFIRLADAGPSSAAGEIALSPRRGAIAGLAYRGLRAGQSVVTRWTQRSGRR